MHAIVQSFQEILKTQLRSTYPLLSESQELEAEPILKEIAQKAEADFKPFDRFFQDEQLTTIVQQASEKTFAHIEKIDANEIRQKWSLVVVDFHRNQYWGHQPTSLKPKRPHSSEQKIRRELFSYIWVFFQSMIVLKTAVYFFGLEYADKREPINLFFLLAAITTSFSSLIFFAYRKSRKQESAENR